MKKVILIMLFLISSTASFAQTGFNVIESYDVESVSCIVTNAEGNPIPAYKFSLQRVPNGATTGYAMWEKGYSMSNFFIKGVALDIKRAATGVVRLAIQTYNSSTGSTGNSAGFNIGDDFWTRKYFPLSSEGSYDRLRLAFSFSQTEQGFRSVIIDNIKIITTNNDTVLIDPGSGVTFISQSESILNKFSLSQNYPNPFNPTTKINFSVPVSGLVSLRVYDVLGKEVTTLVDKRLDAGKYEADFNASHLSSGTYFYKLESGDYVEIKKMILMK